MQLVSSLSKRNDSWRTTLFQVLELFSSTFISDIGTELLVIFK